MALKNLSSRRWIRGGIAGLFVVLSIVAIAVPATPASAQAKSLVWSRLDADIVVLDNGDLRVTETNVIDFTSGTFTFGYRDIDTSRLEQVTDIHVTENGELLRWESGRVDNGRLRIKYYFPSAFNQQRTFVIEYTVKGATRYYLDGDQVYWAGVYADRNGFPVQASRLTVQLPEGALADRVEVYGPKATVTGQGESRVVAEAQAPIPNGQEFEIRVQFPHHIISGAAPAWQQAFDRQRDYDENVKPRNNLLFLTIALVVLIGGPALALVLWFLRGRDPNVGLIADYLNEPPAGIAPGVAGVLVDERADLQDVVATLADLGQRGILAMRESGWLNWVIERGPNFGQPLRYFEQALVDALGLSRRDQVSLADRQQSFYAYLGPIKSGLYQQLIADGYYNHDPEEARSSYRRVGTGLLVAAVVWVAISALFLRGVASTAIWLGLSLAVSGVAFVAVSRVMPVRTRKGAEARMRLNAFRRYLANIEKYTDVKTATDQFTRYLPYAIAFGLERSWVNKFAATSAVAPAWYVPRADRWQMPPLADGPSARMEHKPVSVGSVLETAQSQAHVGLDVSGVARAGAASPGSVIDVNAGITAALSRVNSDLISMFSSAAQVFDSRPPSPTVTALKDTASDIGTALADWATSGGSSGDSSSSHSSGSRSSSSRSGGWSGGGSRSRGSSGGGGGGFG